MKGRSLSLRADGTCRCRAGSSPATRNFSEVRDMGRIKSKRYTEEQEAEICVKCGSHGITPPEDDNLIKDTMLSSLDKLIETADKIEKLRTSIIMLEDRIRRLEAMRWRDTSV